LNVIIKGLMILTTLSLLVACQPKKKQSEIINLKKIDAKARMPKKVQPKSEPYSRYGNPEKYQVGDIAYKILNDPKNFHQEGIASWYGPNFHQKRTSSGEIYDMYELTAAHKLLPIPSYVEVTNVENNKSVIVKVNDRGPFHTKRVIDLSYAAAKALGFLKKGTAKVTVSLLQAPSEASLKWYFQVGAYAKAQNAYNQKHNLQTWLKGTNINVEKDKDRYLVNIGPLVEETATKKMAQSLKEHGVTQFFSYLR
jgi:rare lipoprotein A